ncbi:MAG TPA: Hsp20/alpha crystallin family protein [Desulfitobacteriaceae bacterium]|jgi:HSP20 family protein|nr:Hsp20/alpha crystallin family protein [Desulfitobacteriaceae bacterium]
MALIPYDPFRMLNPIFNEMDRFFRGGKENWSDFIYRVDVEETPTEVVVLAEMPGIEKKEDFSIQVKENILTIKGEVKRGQSEEDKVTRVTERYYGQFSRTLALPASVKMDGAQADYRNGILELRFQKEDHPTNRSIEVNFH